MHFIPLNTSGSFWSKSMLNGTLNSCTSLIFFYNKNRISVFSAFQEYTSRIKSRITEVQCSLNRRAKQLNRRLRRELRKWTSQISKPKLRKNWEVMKWRVETRHLWSPNSNSCWSAQEQRFTTFCSAITTQFASREAQRAASPQRRRAQHSGLGSPQGGAQRSGAGGARAGALPPLGGCPCPAAVGRPLCGGVRCGGGRGVRGAQAAAAPLPPASPMWAPRGGARQRGHEEGREDPAGGRTWVREGPSREQGGVRPSDRQRSARCFGAVRVAPPRGAGPGHAHSERRGLISPRAGAEGGGRALLCGGPGAQKFASELTSPRVAAERERGWGVRPARGRVPSEPPGAGRTSLPRSEESGNR